MSRIIVDIETIGIDFDTLDPKSQEYLLKFSETEEKKENIKKRTALYPLTGEVIVIGMLNPDTMKGVTYFQDAGQGVEDFEEDGMLYKVGKEKEILEKFWETVKTYQQVITFNGRGFDAPFLIMRSAVHKIRPTKNLMGYRYDAASHCDLLDQLTFYGATRKFNLDFCTKSFGICSPKSEEIDGSKVGDFYRAGKCLDIARYCVRDLRATKELYDVWDKYIRF